MTRQVALGPENLVCPLHKEKMSDVCHKCPWWVDITFKQHPQDGGERKEWACSIAVQVMLQINVAREVEKSGKETETFRKMVTERRFPPQELPATPAIKLEHKEAPYEN